MNIQLIRNATMKIEYAGHTILTDPMLSPKGALKSFAGIERNPTVDLPLPMAEILMGLEMVLVSHDHTDHIDPAAVEMLPPTIPLFCQPEDGRSMGQKGFQNVLPIDNVLTWGGISITRTQGRHGQGAILERMGNVSGFVFQAPGEPTLYWAGDSIWCPAVENSLRDFTPDIIVTHSGGATLPGHDPIVMDDRQTVTVFDHISSEAVVVAVHMEALDHCPVTRRTLRQSADSKGIDPSRLRIPADGETLSFHAHRMAGPPI